MKQCKVTFQKEKSNKSFEIARPFFHGPPDLFQFCLDGEYLCHVTSDVFSLRVKELNIALNNSARVPQDRHFSL